MWNITATETRGGWSHIQTEEQHFVYASLQRGFTELPPEGPSLSLMYINLSFIFHLSVIFYPHIVCVSIQLSTHYLWGLSCYASLN